MFNKTLLSVFKRDLEKLKYELNAYQHEAKIWEIQDGIINSAGNLTLHLVGNLNHFIGAVLGNSGYVRERDKEFSLKNIPLNQLLLSVDTTIAIIQFTLDKMSEDDMNSPYPLALPFLEEDKSTRYMLVHLAIHLAYHLGQVNYHRRLLDK